ncbi:hypothetical protein HKX48_002336 [Thoreauomyces humboldtii]|nr:hypothetical protein HKX48_002336 [Thoreauomyces humboldtii]
MATTSTALPTHASVDELADGQRADNNQATVNSIRAMLADVPRYASEPTPITDPLAPKRVSPTASAGSPAAIRAVASAPGAQQHLHGPMQKKERKRRRRKRRRAVKHPLWRRFKRMLARCWSLVCCSSGSHLDEHVRVKIRRDRDGRTVVRSRLVGREGFLAFQDDDEYDDEDDGENDEGYSQDEEVEWEEWAGPGMPDSGSTSSIFSQPSHPATTVPVLAMIVPEQPSFAPDPPLAVAGGLADFAPDLYDEVDNVMRVFARVLATIPQDLSARYLFVGLLGYGGNGFIAAALDRSDGTPVAVKYIARDRVPVGSLIQSLAYPCKVPAEAEILKSLDHPNIVRFKDLYWDDTFFMIVMEKVVNFLRGADEDGGFSSDLPPSTPSAVSFRSTDSIPMTLRNHRPPSLRSSIILTPPQSLFHHVRDSSRTSVGSTRRRTVNAVPASPLFALTQPLDAPLDPPSVTRAYPPPPPPLDTVQPATPPPLLQQPPNPHVHTHHQPTYANLTRPRHGHPGDLDEFLYMYAPLHPLIQRRLSVQLVSAYLHIRKQGFMYLDFRGENVVVDRDFNVRLVDFGMSQRDGDGNSFGVYGTRAFSAPEVLKEGVYDGQQADVWALGCLLFQVATGGVEPFKGVKEVLDRGAGESLKWPEGCGILDDEQKKLVEWMLEGRGADRPGVEDLRACRWLSEDGENEPADASIL